jgi:hypothetical protein
MRTSALPLSLVALAALVPACKSGSAGPECTPTWTLGWGGDGDDRGESVATDAAGNIFVAGWFSETVDFGFGPVVSAGDRDGYVMRRDPSGKIVWVKTFGGPEKDVAWSIAVDASGDVAIAGSFHKSFVFPGETTPITAQGAYDIVVQKYSSDGKLLWHREFGGPKDDHAFGVQFDKTGAVIVVGNYEGKVMPGPLPMESLGQRDAFVIKYDGAGNTVWAKSLGGPGMDFGYGVATDPSGRIFVAGSTMGTADFGAGPSTGGEDTDAVVFALSPEGKTEWVRRYGDRNAQDALVIGAAPDGGFAVGGQFAGTLEIGTTKLTTTADKTDPFFARFDRDGNPKWLSSLSSPEGTDATRGIAVDKDGGVVACGPLLKKGSIEGRTFESKGNSDLFVVKLTPEGKHQWSCAWGADKSQHGYFTTFEPSGSVLVAGTYTGEPKLTPPIPNAKENNAFLMRLPAEGCEGGRGEK